MQFLTILITAVVTAAATQAFIVTTDQWLRRRERRFSLLYAALFLEDFAATCATVVGDKAAFGSSDGHHGIDHGAPPVLADYPDEIDWRRIGIGFTEEAFALRVELQASRAQIAWLYDFDPPDGGDLEVRVETTAIGLRALALAARMRRAGRLGKAPGAQQECSVTGYLTEQQAHHQEIKRAAERAEQQSRSAAILAASELP